MKYKQGLGSPGAVQGARRGETPLVSLLTKNKQTNNEAFLPSFSRFVRMPRPPTMHPMGEFEAE